MKNDMNDLKSLVFELIKSNDLSVSNVNKLKQLQSHTSSQPSKESNPYTDHRSLTDHNHKVHPDQDYNFKEKDDDHHVFIPTESEHDTYDSMEIVEESLSLEDMEKDMIKKALKKHKGRRKDASIDLGISERTLYRKIKQYELG